MDNLFREMILGAGKTFFFLELFFVESILRRELWKEVKKFRSGL